MFSKKHEQIHLIETEIDTDYVICMQFFPPLKHLVFQKRENNILISIGWTVSNVQYLNEKNRICIRYNSIESIENGGCSFFSVADIPYASKNPIQFNLKGKK